MLSAAGNLQGPCGYDAFSYSWRDIDGSAFHKSNGPFLVWMDGWMMVNCRSCVREWIWCR